MPSTIDDLHLQARQGSVAAIIHLLNEHFAPSGIRTRAVQDNGVLQLLVEAATAEQLPQATVVEEVKTVLESISPKGITKVNINSRIVQEQQLLWLDEVKRDPENSLLWAEPVTLRRANAFLRMWQDFNTPRQRTPFLANVPSSKTVASRSAFWRGLIGGASLALLLLIVGWATKDWLRASLGGSPQPAPAVTPEPPPPPVDEDPFVLAVRIAQQAVTDGQTATSTADWLDLAVRWQRASDLMAEVPPEDERYPIAQDRRATYAENKALALAAAERTKASE
ncbi:MAG: hypothetical protein VKI82_11880 [Leptolyngbya sp.]|nr:hypothetical protein [Leptolyngbya sp.]